MEEGVPIEAGMVTKAIERAQKQVEGQNFSYRKHLLEYDDVMNKQRVAIYRLRRRILEGEDQRGYVMQLAEDAVAGLIDLHASTEADPDDWDFSALRDAMRGQFGFAPEPAEGTLEELGRDDLADFLTKGIHDRYQEREEEFGPEMMRAQERYILLHVVDSQWKDHLYAMDQLKQGIGLRGYGQRDPLIEYKKESFAMFGDMWSRIESEAVRLLYFLKAAASRPAPGPRPVQTTASRSGPGLAPPPTARGAPAPAGPKTPIRRQGRKVGRNDPCPCGSGKKYKKCHAA